MCPCVNRTEKGTDKSKIIYPTITVYSNKFLTYNLANFGIGQSFARFNIIILNRSRRKI